MPAALPNQAFLLLHTVSQLRYHWYSAPPPQLLAELRSLECGPASDLTLRETLRRMVASADLRAAYPRFTRDVDDLGPPRILKAAAAHLRFCQQAEASLLSVCDPEYPESLLSIPNPPLLLTARGDLGLLRKPMIAVVGSRKASALALLESFATGNLLAKIGITVVSGGAFGCDIAAHRGVLVESSTPTAAALVVMAGGLDELYPRANAAYFSQLWRRRALFLSERLVGTPCLPHDFPIRNRIIAGLATKILIMEAKIASGAMVTAQLGADYGRDVLALTPDGADVRFDGNRHLIADGALAFCNTTELLELLGWQINDGG